MLLQCNTYESQTHQQRWLNIVQKTQFSRSITVSLTTFCCPFCNVLLFSGEKSSFCFSNGKLGLKPLSTLPIELETIYNNTDFRRTDRRYNHNFAFSALGVQREEGFIQLPAPYCLKIYGRTYHKVSCTTARWLFMILNNQVQTLTFLPQF
ncbi:hypothetical protein BB558_007012 [Smittium angustum]|uniref:Uncharacterized protein n=1 Tax=Smittium angustum TaxID=133377 RepID=A0A2U1IWF1_SMIAN|nr:hypothetical protein BB558_007012 [Smittium angustum]